MYTRKDYRYCIKRCRNQEGDPQPHHLEVYEHLLEQKPDNLDVHDFPMEWDVLVDSQGKLHFIKPEKDEVFVNSTLTEAKILAKRREGFESFSERQKNILN